MKRYKTILPLLLVMSCLSLTRCNEGDLPEDVGRDIVFTDSLPNVKYAVAVQNLKVVPVYLGMDLEWDAVADENLAYYEIEWQGSNPDKSQYNLDTTVYTAQTKEVKYKIENLYNETYTVKVRAVSKNMMKSEFLVNKPITPEEDLVSPTGFELKIVSAVGQSAQFTWKNPEVNDFYCVEVLVKKKGEADWTIKKRSIKSETTMTVLNLAPLTEYEYEIKAYDRVGNYSSEDEIKRGEMKTRNIVKYKGIQVFRYSSAELKMEGTNGAAQLIVDGDKNTYWHSTWNGGKYWVPGYYDEPDKQSGWNMGYYSDNAGWSNGSFPQYVMLDFGKPVNPVRITVWPRQGGAYGAIKSFEIKGTPYDPLVYDPDYWDSGLWTINYGMFDSGKSGDTKDPIVCNLSSSDTTQYLKMNFLSNTAGDGYARVAEVEVEVLADE